jgi:hypothetical protein
VRGDKLIALTETTAAIETRTAARLRACLELAGHAADIDGPLFRPLHHNGKRRDQRRGMDPDDRAGIGGSFSSALWYINTPE